MERTLAKKIITNIFYFIFWDIFIYFILFVTFFQSLYFIYHNQKVAKHCKEKKINHNIWSKNKKVIQSKKKLNIFSLKIHKGAGMFKKIQNLSK